MTKGGDSKGKIFHSESVHANGNHQHKETKTAMKPDTLHRDDVPCFHREPFINSGYRNAENITVRQCIATLFTIHNETFNIWSHLVAGIGFFLYSISCIIEHGIVGNPLVYPLLCFVISASMMLLLSSLAHLFCCMSWKARHFCFYVDYAAISVFTLGSSVGFVFYCRPTLEQSSSLHANPYYNLGMGTIISAIFTFSCCISRHGRFLRYRYFLRTGLAIMKLLYDVSPFWARCGFYQSTNICSTFVLNSFNRFKWCYLLSAITNALRLPERLFPGRFDLFGHSHHFLHVLTPLGIYNVFHLFLYEMIDRKDFISTSPYPPTFLTTFGFLLALISINCCIVVWFACNWLQVEEEEMFSGSHYTVIYKRSSERTSLAKNDGQIDLKKIKIN